MKKIVLMAVVGIINFCMTGESLAECVNNQTCGESCCWSIQNNTLYVAGSGKMDEFYHCRDNGNGTSSCNNNRPWENYVDEIDEVNVQGLSYISEAAFSSMDLNHVVIGDTVKELGVHAFAENNLTEIDLPSSLSIIGEEAFAWNYNIHNVVIPDSVTDIKDGAFHDTELETVIIPASISNIGYEVFGENHEFIENLQIICKGNEVSCVNLQKMLSDYTFNDRGEEHINLSDEEHFNLANSEQCIGSYIFEKGSCHKRNENQCNNTNNYYWNGAECVYRQTNGKISCTSSYKVNDGFCDRIRYTPAEAAKVLRDDNSNSVTITFKK